MTWTFPIICRYELPQGDHPGAFGTKRKYDIHTGIDLYCYENESVQAVEDGQVIKIEKFTGESAGSPWWNETEAIWVKGKSGIVVYGEVKPQVKMGEQVIAGQQIAKVMTVLRKDKGKPMSMLHLELYEVGMKETVWWKHGDEKPPFLLNPTNKLVESLGGKHV